MTDKYTILHGDSLQELKKLGDRSIDSVVTDPPYGLSKEPKIEEVLTKWLAGEEYDHGHGGFMGKSRKVANNHPTVKPLDLMAWLVRLVTPPEGIVLDPFAGSGSTLVAAKREGFGFVGVELTDEYIPIIEARTGIKAETSEGKATE